MKKEKRYNKSLDFLKISKGVRVTCDLIVEVDNGKEILEEIGNDICDIMSIACGTRVQWIYYYSLNSEKKIVSWIHVSKVTKPCFFNEIINPEEHTMKNFLESSYVALAEKSNMLRYSGETTKPLINAYLDAKADNDYLEGRGIKLVVVMEMLKKALLKDEPELECIINEDYFKKQQQNLQIALKEIFEQYTNSDLRRMFYSNIRGINRTPFEEILNRLCKRIDLQVKEDYLQAKEDYLQAVVDSRNKLIHEGNFLCESDDKKEKYRKIEDYPQFQDPEHEYYFLMNFVDKCFLRLLNYKGLYYKWETASKIKPDKL